MCGVAVKEAVEVKEEAANGVTVTNDGGYKGSKAGEGCFQLDPILYGEDTIFTEEICGVLHVRGGGA